MRNFSALIMGVAISSLGGCQLPKQLPPEKYLAACEGASSAVADRALMVSMRMPDCRSGSLIWSSFRSPTLEFASFSLETPPVRIHQNSFWTELKRQVAERGRPIIYIHGYRNTEWDANRRALAIQAASDGRPVVSIVWPSFAQTTKYYWDEANNEWAREHLRSTINEIARLYPGTDLVAHSMGNRILLDVLLTAPASGFAHVVMGSPDVDRDMLQFLLRRPNGLGFPTTVYASLKDQALSSSWRAHGAPRGGDLAASAGSDKPQENLYPVLANADLVDTTKVRLAFVGHADFIETPQGAEDFCLVLKGITADVMPTREKAATAHHWVLRKYPVEASTCAAAATTAVNITKAKRPGR